MDYETIKSLDWYKDGRPNCMIFSDEEYTSPEHSEELWKETHLPHILVSNEGRFFNEETRRFKQPTHGDGEGHKAVKTQENGKRMQAYAHRLIANAFVPNPDNLPLVRHLNDVPDDNDISNLAWGTQRDNALDSMKNGHNHFVSPEEREKGLDKVRRPVIVTNLKTQEKAYYRSIEDSCRATGAQQGNVCKVLKGERHHTCGYYFEYTDREVKE